MTGRVPAANGRPARSHADARGASFPGLPFGECSFIVKRPSIRELLSLLIHALIDRGNFREPLATLPMIQVENRLGRPVKVVRDKGYLLVKRFEGVA